MLNNIAYYPTSNGSFYALNIGTCDYVWQVNVTKICYDFQPLSALQENNTLPISRSSPQADGDVLYFATQAHALIVAVDLNTGNFLGTVQVSNHPLAILTMSPTVYDGKIFIGASSQEESASVDPEYDCCNFIGNFAAYSFDRSANKFTQLWSLNTLPSGQGWSGASVWGSQPAIDPTRKQVFVGTGNTYVYPPEYEKCLNETASCLPPDVWQDSVIAIDIPSGKANWRRSISPLDGWVMACGYADAPVSNSPLCPVRPGPDADFGMAPTFVPAALGTGTTGDDSIVIGQKNGNLYSFNAVTGDIQWNIMTSSVSEAGGLSWGIAVDELRIYFTAINFGSLSWTLQTSGSSINNSAFGAANLKTGDIVWETACPDDQLSYSPPGAVNDVVFVGKSGSRTAQISGAVLALSKTTGSILHSWPVDSVQHGGIMAQGGFMMFGTGYHFVNPFKNGSFYVYGLPDAIAKAKIQPTSHGSSGSGPTGDEPGISGNQVGNSTRGVGKKSIASRMGGSMILTAIYPVAFLAVLMIWLG